MYKSGLWKLLLLALSTLLLLVGCGGGGSATGGSGTLSLSLVDSSLPGIQAVYVTVDHVDVHPQGGNWQTVLTPQQTVNLLELVNGLQQDLGLTTLAAGPYDQLRLVLGSSPDAGLNLQGQPHPFASYLIDAADAVQELKVPSGLQTGIKLTGGFTIADGGTTDLVLDFDAARSVVIAGSSGQYLLKPTISVVSSAASVAGTVTDQAQAPLPDTQVSAQTTGPVAAEISASRLIATTLSDADGGYRLFLNPGGYQLVAFRPGAAGTAWGPACRELSLVADQTLSGQDFALNAVPSGILSVNVSFTPAPPDQHAVLSLRQAPPAPCSLPVELATLQVAAGASLDLELPPGDYQLIASLEGAPTQAIALTVTAGATTTQAVSF